MRRTFGKLVATVALSVPLIGAGLGYSPSVFASTHPTPPYPRLSDDPLAVAAPLNELYAGRPLTTRQRKSLIAMARRTWRFFTVDVKATS